MFPELDMQISILAILCLQVLMKPFPNDKFGKTGQYLACVCSLISWKVKKIGTFTIHLVLTKRKYGKTFLCKYSIKTNLAFPLLSCRILTQCVCFDVNVHACTRFRIKPLVGDFLPTTSKCWRSSKVDCGRNTDIHFILVSWFFPRVNKSEKKIDTAFLKASPQHLLGCPEQTNGKQLLPRIGRGWNSHILLVSLIFHQFFLTNRHFMDTKY